MPACDQIEVADRAAHFRGQAFALIGRCLPEESFHVHAEHFTKKIKHKQALFIFLVVYLDDKNNDDRPMTREEIRRENARKLAAREESKAAFARAVNMEPSQVSQIIGPNPNKNIGNSVARRIERAYNLPESWLDVAHPELSVREEGGTAAAEATEVRPASPATSAPELREVGTFSTSNVLDLLPGAMRVREADADDPALTHIPKVKLRLSAGISGFDVEPERFDGSTTTVPTNWIERNKYSREKLFAIRVKGESMEPTLYEDDLVVINTADTRPTDGGVYAINFEGEPVVKRLTRDAGQWWLTSDHADQRKFYRRVCQGNDCIIVGRVVRRESERF